MGHPDLARAQYRLALVLYEQRRQEEAETMEKKALKSIPDYDPSQSDDRDGVMTLLDRRAFIEYGRSTGAFRGNRTGRA
jgi:tetratricopeptide (TPR) repeat protein